MYDPGHAGVRGRSIKHIGPKLPWPEKFTTAEVLNFVLHDASVNDEELSDPESEYGELDPIEEEEISERFDHTIDLDIDATDNLQSLTLVILGLKQYSIQPSRRWFCLYIGVECTWWAYSSRSSMSKSSKTKIMTEPLHWLQMTRNVTVRSKTGKR